MRRVWRAKALGRASGEPRFKSATNTGPDHLAFGYGARSCSEKPVTSSQIGQALMIKILEYSAQLWEDRPREGGWKFIACAAKVGHVEDDRFIEMPLLGPVYHGADSKSPALGKPLVLN
ncbi:MAG: hypothetical protein MMC23_008187 [Stictis urceolatum]|nr:hypothetical protein [Stictis urceolata]